MKNLFLVVFALTIVFGTTLPACGPAGEQGPSGNEEALQGGRSGLPITGLDSLTTEQKQLALKILNEQRCSGPHAVSVSRCVKAAGAVIADVGAGKNEQEIVKDIFGKGPSKQAEEAEDSEPYDDCLAVYKVEIGESTSIGPADAKVTIVKFVDIQCPYCKRTIPTVEKIMNTYGDDVRVVFKNNPLPFHKEAPLAAEAALAAGDQGKFWEMYKLLLDKQKALKKDDLLGYASSLGLNTVAFEKALDDNAHKDLIDKEQKQARALGATGTPAFFINGRYLRGAQPFEKFKPIIDEEIAGKRPPFRWAKNVKEQEKAKKKAEEKKVHDIDPGASYSRGPQGAKITMIEFSDFECPFSKKFQVTIGALLEAHPEKIRHVFKHNPLKFHKKAPLAHQAVLAAGEQDKFWEMHAKIFEDHKKIEKENLLEKAEALGLDVGKFTKALDDGTYKEVVDGDLSYGAKYGVRGTPTIFINGRKIVGAQPLEKFESVIDEELKKTGSTS